MHKLFFDRSNLQPYLTGILQLLRLAKNGKNCHECGNLSCILSFYLELLQQGYELTADDRRRIYRTTKRAKELFHLNQATHTQCK